MSCFKTHIATTTATAPDPTKRVNYQLGMVLGEDDFNQEFAYLAGRDQWLARDLIGYGTARGLRVRTEMDGGELRVVVEPGVALSPSGQLVCVPAAQCARLNQWLLANQSEVSRRLSSPPGDTLTLYVTLCYRECKTDDVPIPGEPCRSEDDLTAPSRIADDFQLELKFDPTLQREEDALRDFADWLKQVDVTDAVADSTPLEEFLQAIRNAASPWLSPPGSPPSSPPADFMFGSPPGSIHIRPRDVCEYLRAAFRVWVTELRPHWIGRGQGCAPDLRGEQADEDCVMLAELSVPLLPNPPNGWVVDNTIEVTINESRRAYAVHLRMLQEWLLCGRHLASNASGASGPPAADTVVSETAFGQGDAPGNSLSYSRADHTHGTPALPDLSGDVTGPINNNVVSRLLGVIVEPVPPGPAPAQNQVLTCVNVSGILRWRAAILPAPPAPALGGDVTGAVIANTVARIRGVNVDATAPTAGQVLTAVQVGPNVTWRPAAIPQESGPFVTMDLTPASGVGVYAIVAAGRVRANRTNIGLVYNALVAEAISVNQIRLQFNGYRAPDATFQYIVKAMTVFNSVIRAPVVVFESFRDDGIILRVTDDGANINVIAQVELMVEISKYLSSSVA